MSATTKTASAQKPSKVASLRSTVRIPGELTGYITAAMKTRDCTATDLILEALRFHRDGFQRRERDHDIEGALAAQSSRMAGLESSIADLKEDSANIVALLRMSLGFDEAEAPAVVVPAAPAGPVPVAAPVAPAAPAPAPASAGYQIPAPIEY